MRVTLDTNILAYAEGVGDEVRCTAAVTLIEQLPAELVLLPAQTLGELYRVLTGKTGREASDVREAILAWADSFEVADTSWVAFQSALVLAADHGLQIGDALILSVAADNRCRLLRFAPRCSRISWWPRKGTVLRLSRVNYSPIMTLYA